MKPFIKMLNDAAEDPDVVSIKMTLYRVADRSKIIDALIEAAETEKKWWYLWNCGHGLTRQITLRCRTGSKMPAARFCMDWAITKYIRSFA